MNNLTILNVIISQNANGLYSLNDLHKSAVQQMSEILSGGELLKWGDKKKPIRFMDNERTQNFIAVLEENLIGGYPPIKESSSGAAGGTYGCKELLCSYASWLSPHIDVEVHKAFIEKVEQKSMTQMEMVAAQALAMVEVEKQVAQIPILTSKLDEISDKISFLQSPKSTVIPPGFMSKKQVMKHLSRGLSTNAVFDMAFHDKLIPTSEYMAIVDGVGFVKNTAYETLGCVLAINEFIGTLSQVTKTQCETKLLPGKRVKYLKVVE